MLRTKHEAAVAMQFTIYHLAWVRLAQSWMQICMYNCQTANCTNILHLLGSSSSIFAAVTWSLILTLKSLMNRLFYVIWAWLRIIKFQLLLKSLETFIIQGMNYYKIRSIKQSFVIYYIFNPELSLFKKFCSQLL